MGSPTIIPPFGSKIGFSNNVPISDYIILANITAVFPNPGGEQTKILSTSASDIDSISGTGAKKLRIRYFDSNMVLNDEIISTNGTSSVNSVATDIQIIESFETFQVGTANTAIGTITLSSLDGLRIFAQIDPGNFNFTQALHWVSPGKIGYMTDITVNCAFSGGVTFIIFSAVDNTALGGGIVFSQDLYFTMSNNSATMSLNIPIRCDASHSFQPIQMGVAAKGLASNQLAAASFHYKES